MGNQLYIFKLHPAVYTQQDYYDMQYISYYTDTALVPTQK